MTDRRAKAIKPVKRPTEAMQQDPSSHEHQHSEPAAASMPIGEPPMPELATFRKVPIQLGFGRTLRVCRYRPEASWRKAGYRTTT